MTTYQYHREDTTAHKLANRDRQLKEARQEIHRLQQRIETLTKDRQRLYSRVHALKKVRPLYAPKPVQPRDEAHARLLAAVNEAYKPRTKDQAA